MRLLGGRGGCCGSEKGRGGDLNASERRCAPACPGPTGLALGRSEPPPDRLDATRRREGAFTPCTLVPGGHHLRMSSTNCR